MPILRNRTALELARNLSAFLNLEIGVVRGRPPAPDAPPAPDGAALPAPQLRKELEQARKRLENRERENARLRAELAGKNASEGVRPENFVWIFGSGRSGSTWLSHLLTDLEEHTLWGEPLVGKLFADLYYGQTGRQQSEVEHFVLSRPYEGTWLNSIRNFVLDGATARFPHAAGPDNYVVASEPNGSAGAPLLSRAMPESRLVFLIRDPRDVVSSFLAAAKKGSWLDTRWGRSQNTLADDDPDTFVKQRANWFMQHAGHAREAYENHEGPKAQVRYENLRADTLEELNRIYDNLGVEIDREKLPQVVHRHSWENIPAEQKGENKFFRKARPGGWQDDLTPGQARIVEQITAPLMKEYYPE